MARTEQVTCDVCGAQKQESNHWFVVQRTHLHEANTVVVMTDCAYRQNKEAYDDNLRECGVRADCCGEACVIRKVSELIAAK